ncbi:helix-turn-helix domain-containing protein [Streptomyces sp. NPDC006175]|uniref:PucR family transcriptional regulator n=1 Tax=unclassified Streptomyces TaxID=2593676 RepID=UPI0033ADCC72
MTDTMGDLATVGRVRAETDALAEEIACAVLAESAPGGSAPADRERLLPFARHAVEEALEAAGRPPRGGFRAGQGTEPPTAPRWDSLAPDLVRTVRQTAFARTWRVLVDGADAAERIGLLRVAAEFFEQAGHAQAASAPTRRDPASAGNEALYREVAEALLDGRPAEPLASRHGVRLAPSYAVALVRPREPRWRPAIDRYAILTAERQDAEVLLLPTLLPVPWVRLRAFCERMLDGVVDVSRTRASVASAQTHEHIPAALEEARTVQHVTDVLEFDDGVHQLSDMPVEAALTRCPDLAQLLMSRLVPLHGNGASLMHTLLVYVNLGQDRRCTAQALHIHPNTLDYRLRRIRELTGLAPTVPQDLQALLSAMTAWRLARGPITAAT